MDNRDEVVEWAVEQLRRDDDDITAWPLQLLLTDSGNAAMFARQRSGSAVYTVGRGWMVWDGKVWARDAANAQVTRWMQEVAREWLQAAATEGDTDTARRIAQHAARSLDARRIDAALSIAARMMVVADSAFDADPFVLNAQNGILDLKAGTLRDHDPAAMCSRIAGASYVPDAPAPRWQRFVGEVFAGDAEMVTFAKRWCGYCLTGDTSEQRYMIAWGDGANGKSTLFNILKKVLGTYATDISTASLAQRRDASNINTDIARLPGVRLAVAPEWDEDVRADEAMLKSLTGQDTIAVRTLYREPIEFRPNAKLVIHGNRRPVLRGTDGGTWRRPLLTPFTECFTGSRCDPHLGETLADEADGILADLVRACLDWQASGLAIPARVADATEGYRRESDDVAQYVEQCCIVSERVGGERVSVLHEDYIRWGGSIRTVHKFGRAIRELGYITEKTRDGYVVRGLGIMLR